jgi:hypothetical protein
MRAGGKGRGRAGKGLGRYEERKDVDEEKKTKQNQEKNGDKTQRKWRRIRGGWRWGGVRKREEDEDRNRFNGFMSLQYRIFASKKKIKRGGGNP